MAGEIHELRTALNTERSAHEEHRQQLADALGKRGGPGTVPQTWELLIEHAADAHRWATDGALGNTPAAKEAKERAAAAEAALADAREKHKARLREADEKQRAMNAELERYAEGTERPVMWSVYNRMHVRAATAEAKTARAGRITRRLVAHALGFQDALDDTDRDPWARMVRADLDELLAALDGDQPAVAPERPAQQARERA
jgi:hypothetical protein